MVFLRNSSHLTYYKITTCVGQQETVVFLKEFITFDKLQNYCISVEQEEMVIFFIKTILLQIYYSCSIGRKYRSFVGILKHHFASY